MSALPPKDPTALGKFLEQYSKDLDAKVSRTLDEYLVLFPGDSERIAEEYLALKRFRDDGEPAPPSGVPLQISHYRILKELGRGGQGVVYLAKDVKLGREVAIKMLRRSRLALGELERLQREARIASRLDHPGICPIYDIGDYAGEPYVVMRYVRGTSLSEKLEHLRSTSATTFTFIDVFETDLGGPGAADDPGEPRPAAKPPQKGGPPTPSGKEIHAVLRLIEQVARALHEAHEAKIVHRDVKPGNIIVTPEGQPVLLDFGVATMVEEGGGHGGTRTGETPGTPPYMSPEQTSGKRVQLDRRTDVYSLGVTLYECLTLKLPFADTTDFARQIMFVPPPDPRHINPAISKDLRVVIDTALEKDRNRRYATAADFADDLRRVRDKEPIRARPIGVHTRLLRWVQRNPVIAASLGTVLAVLTTALILVIGALHSAKAAEASEREHRKVAEDAIAIAKPLVDYGRVLDLRRWDDKLWPAAPQHVDGDGGMRAWLGEARELVNRKNEHERALHTLESLPPDLRSTDHTRQIRVHTDLIAALSKLPERIRDMERRLEGATTLWERTIGSKRSEWAEVAKALARDPRFASISSLKPQLGLIPIGKGEAGLFEFAVADTCNPGYAGTMRAESAPVVVDEVSPAILVLLPGGTLRFDRRLEAMASPPSPSDFESTVIPPYFLGKHEITQSQWFGLMGSNPAVAQVGTVPVEIDVRHPVENVTWTQCSEFCRRLGMRLPAQDEWELAARSTTGAEFGDCAEGSCLEGRENLGDLACFKATGKPALHVSWNDDYPLHAPVGSFRPNGFGFHDMLGNVSEWCSDRVTRPRISSAAAASLPPDATDKRRIARGGSWTEGLLEASCRYARLLNPEQVGPSLGLRIARSIDP